MSTLYERLSARFEAGHAGPAPELLSDNRIADAKDLRASAVLVAFTDRKEPGLLMLHRPSHMRAHPGQVAFPGGKIDPGESAQEAALREAWEELGIPPGEVRVIGSSDEYKTFSGYAITPVLAVVPHDLVIRPNPTEVARWFEAPARFAFDEQNHVQRFVDWEGSPRCYYEIQWQEHRIWGVTAALVVNLSRRLAALV